MGQCGYNLIHPIIINNAKETQHKLMSNIPIIAGNWKMHGLSDALSTALLIDEPARLSLAKTVIFPPATLLDRLSQTLKAIDSPIEVGGQNCRSELSGAYTGGISAEMLKDAGATRVLVGHSERRHGLKEACELVAKKTLGALRAGLSPMICIGETLEEREAGQTQAVLTRHLSDSLPDALAGKDFQVAYEPVWAIGTGHIPTDSQIVEAMSLIRANLKARFKTGPMPHILYGGSVKPDNAAQLLSLEGVDGLLVGGASLLAKDFTKIIEAAGRDA
jgi:triosephosphate isomerase (TIM)